MKFFFNKRSHTTPPLIIPAPLQENITDTEHVQNEIACVIALSLHIYIKRMREYENSIITMQKVMKPYSPWSSKIYGLRPQLTHRPALKPSVKRY